MSDPSIPDHFSFFEPFNMENHNYFHQSRYTYTSDERRQRDASQEARLLEQAFAGDVAGLIELTREADWPQSYPLDQVMTDYVSAHAFYGKGPHPEVMGIGKPGHVLPDNMPEKTAQFNALLADERIPLVAKIVGADKLIDRVSRMIGDTDPRMDSFAALTATKDAVMAQQQILLKEAPDLNAIACETQLDVSNPEQVSFYAHAVDWSTRIVKPSLKGKLFGQIVQQIKEPRKGASALEHVDLAMAAGHIAEQLGQSQTPVSMPPETNSIYQKVVRLASSDQVEPVERIGLWKKLLANGNAVSIGKTVKSGADIAMPLREDLSTQNAEQTGYFLNLLNAAKTQTFNSVKGVDDPVLRTERLHAFATLEKAVSGSVIRDVAKTTALLPQILTGHELALDEDGVKQARGVRPHLSAAQQADLDRCVARGAIRTLLVDQVTKQPSSAKTAQAFGYYYATLPSLADRDSMKNVLEQEGNTQTRAGIALNLMAKGQSAYRGRANLLDAAVANVGDLFRGDRFKKGLQQTAKLTA